MSNGTWTRRAALGSITTGAVLIASETLGFSLTENLRNVGVGTAGDKNAFLGIDALNEGALYTIPYDVDFINKTGKEITVTLAADRTSVSFDQNGFTIASGGTETVTISDWNLICNEKADTTITISAAATDESISVNGDRPITLKKEPACVTSGPNNLKWNNETESCLVNVQEDTSGSYNFHPEAKNSTFESCFFGNVSAGDIDIDPTISNTTIDGTFKIEATGENLVQADFGNIEVGSTTIMGDLIVKAYAPDISGVPDESELENQIGGAVTGEISVTKSQTPPSDDPPKEGVEEVDGSTPVGEVGYLEYGLQIAPDDSRTVTDVRIETPDNQNGNVSGAFTYLHVQSGPDKREVKLTVDGTGNNGDLDRGGNVSTYTTHTLDNSATFSDGAELTVWTGLLEGKNDVYFAYDLVDDESVADIVVSLGFNDGTSHETYLQVTSANT